MGCPDGPEDNSDAMDLLCDDGSCVRQLDPADQFVPRYGQCGGRNYEGSRRCAPVLVCVQRDDFYSQCDQAEGVEGVSLYGQCGGSGYTGATECVPGADCVAVDEYYSQCRPN